MLNARRTRSSEKKLASTSAENDEEALRNKSDTYSSVTPLPSNRCTKNNVKKPSIYQHLSYSSRMLTRQSCQVISATNSKQSSLPDSDQTQLVLPKKRPSSKKLKHLMKRKINDVIEGETLPGKKSCNIPLRVSQLASSDDVRVIDSAETKTLSLPLGSEEWLQRFLHWNAGEKIKVLDGLINVCQPHEVRHMMNIIKPRFQRDFISLLPKELALYVLSFLEPSDLFVAAQTCKYWRILAEDNLMWKEKCTEQGIFVPPRTKGSRLRKNGGVGAGKSWKALFLQQAKIEMNWRDGNGKISKVLKGHDDHVITCLQFTGSRIVSGSDDNTLKVWSAISGKCLRTLTGHSGGVWASQMKNNLIISGSTDRTLRIWNSDTGNCVHILYGHTSTVRCLAQHEDIVVSGSRDATLRVWDINTGECLHVLVGHMAAVRCVCYDGKKVISGAYDYMVKVWDPETEECLHTLQGHTNRVYSLQFDGSYIVSGSLDTSIRVWKADTGACLHTLMGHQSLTSGMELRDNILVSGNADSTVKIWNILTGECLKTLEGFNKHLSAVTCLQFYNKFVITSSDDGTVKLWDMDTGKVIRDLVTLDSRGSGGVVWRIKASRTKLVCAVGSRNGTEETKLLVLDFDPDTA